MEQKGNEPTQVFLLVMGSFLELTLPDAYDRDRTFATASERNAND